MSKLDRHLAAEAPVNGMIYPQNRRPFNVFIHLVNVSSDHQNMCFLGHCVKIETVCTSFIPF